MDGLNGDRVRTPADWVQPPSEQEGLSRYVETLRERIWLIVAAVALTTGLAIVYLVLASKVYTADAELLVTPFPTNDATAVSLPLIRESADPTRPVQTAAALVTNLRVAQRVADKLNLQTSPQDLLDEVTAVPLADSDIVSVSADAATPAEARDLANAFASQTIADRTAVLHQTVRKEIPILNREIANSGVTGIDQGSLRVALSSLAQLQHSSDPTLTVGSEAQTPTAPSSPRPALTIVAGVIAGLVLGIAAAFAAQVLDPKLRREEQLRRMYRLPILARIPKESRGSEGKPLHPLTVSPATSEAYRTLRGTIAAARRSAKRESSVILVTGSTPTEGKSSTAINLASSLAASGNSVILIEADLRRPAIGKALDVVPEHGIVSVLIESVALGDALVTSPVTGQNLGLLLADYAGGWITELFSLPASRDLILEARRLADYVIIDSPPLTDVIDALPLTDDADEVLVVVRLGRTQLHKLTQLGELLAENSVRPMGFAVIGTARPGRDAYAYYAERAQQAPTPRRPLSGRRRPS